jgi:predicted Fe-Mo cluster-binding NifX family protein
MKIVFSAEGSQWDSLVDPRLGRAALFAVYDEEMDTLSSVANTTKEANHGAGLQMAKNMIDMQTDVIITGNGPGEKASAVLAKSNIEIYVGAGEMSLKDAYDAYKSGKLTKF